MGRSFEVRKASMAKTAGAKTKVYSKYSKEIYVVAKNGSPDPEANLALRGLIERAKKEQVPSHVIEKAIAKAAGGAGEDYEAMRYEGFGPGNTMVIVDCLTDNNKRTFTEVRQAFVKNDAKLGSPGTCAHMFDHQAIFAFAGDDEDGILEILMMDDVDVTDVEVEDGMTTVFAPHTEFFKVKTSLSNALPGVEFEMEEITFAPQTYTKVEGDDLAAFDKFINALEDCDDVQNVYHNAEL
ncbi:YebC/PmpR family DNA-binding transcriptional regulator [uncultured Ferrimonas sp.]|uniref:YebC/PmpR family DNA-binding transcriptional regulator n=1 Tax=uncultured Ferrimonas sp. TaxID=432640 RepID=UPI00262FB016|nr:YebC/PmpR family DNA-binding transcriptional regulator [uncultured Ferrimonas sp.]